MTDRWELVELIGQTGQSASKDKHLMARQTAEAILDAVGPLIRADERERTLPNDGLIVAKALAYDGLRAQVEALPGAPVSGAEWIARSDVLALLDGPPRVTREELIEAGVQVLAEWYGDEVSEVDVVALLDKWEPLIRADERERTNTVGGHRQIRDEGRADMCADLRAKVEALPGIGLPHTVHRQGTHVKRDDVLALLDGA